MIEKELTVKNQLGIHLRPAALFTQIANKHKSSIKVSNEQGVVDGRSIMGLMMIAASYNTKIKLSIEGEDEAELFSELQKLVEVQRFDEE